MRFTVLSRDSDGIFPALAALELFAAEGNADGFFVVDIDEKCVSLFV